MKQVAIAMLLAVAALAQGANHSATLTWTFTQGTGDPATGFHVFRAPTCTGTFTQVGTVSSPTTLTFTDSTVTAGQSYCYQVTAFNTGGDGPPSASVQSAVVPFQAPTASPSAPTVTVK